MRGSVRNGRTYVDNQRKKDWKIINRDVGKAQATAAGFSCSFAENHLQTNPLWSWLKCLKPN